MRVRALNTGTLAWVVAVLCAPRPRVVAPRRIVQRLPRLEVRRGQLLLPAHRRDETDRGREEKEDVHTSPNPLRFLSVAKSFVIFFNGSKNRGRTRSRVVFDTNASHPHHRSQRRHQRVVPKPRHLPCPRGLHPEAVQLRHARGQGAASLPAAAGERDRESEGASGTGPSSAVDSYGDGGRAKSRARNSARDEHRSHWREGP